MRNRFSKTENTEEPSSESTRTARPPLHLKTNPANGPELDQELEEMVPEFMHRGFYRSEEDLSPVEAGAKLKPLRRKVSKPINLYDREADEDLDNDSVLDTVVVEHEGQELFEPVSDSLQPLRKVAVPEIALYPSKPSGPGPLPRPVETKNLSLPMVVGFLLVVGLFLWREQTRPTIDVAESLPVPRSVTVTEEALPDTELLGESRYPVNETTPLAEPRDTNVPESLDSVVALPSSEDSPEPIPDLESDNLAERDSDAQRAAILSRMSDGTVSKGQSDSRSSSSIAPSRPARAVPSAPPEDLFPDVPETDVVPAPIPPAPKASTAPTKKPIKSAVPEERKKVEPLAPIASKQAPVAAQVAPARPSSVVTAPPKAPVVNTRPVIEPIPELPAKGTNYEISEPSL